tara:strand:- start:4625 stop:5002 length:378 start_codon:yes stop_codon:yes gene_type:complete
MIKNSYIFKFFILVSLLSTSNQVFSKKNNNMLDLVSEVIAKEVFKQMRIKFDPKSLKTVKEELKSQKVPQNFLSYFSCQVKTKTYQNIKSCLKNITQKESFNVYTTSLSEAITNLYNKKVVVFLM